MTWRLTPDEDAELRRLHALIRFANGTSALTERYRQLRARDRRNDVREVRNDDLVHEVAIPYPAASGDDRKPGRSADPEGAAKPTRTADRTSGHIDGAGPRVR
jgi:hypothetical protein